MEFQLGGGGAKLFTTRGDSQFAGVYVRDRAIAFRKVGSVRGKAGRE
jgi:hypothetical protein